MYVSWYCVNVCIMVLCKCMKSQYLQYICHIYMIEKNNKKRNQNVDIKFSACDTFLEYPSSDALKFERLESQIILKSVWEK